MSRALTTIVLSGLVAAGGVAVGSAGSGRPGGSGGSGLTGVTGVSRPIAVPRSPAKLLGQRVMVGLPGLTASPGLLGQIRRGEIGSVILFSYNISGSAQLRALTGSLQRAAAAGHNPPLLIATDQEGGQVKRLAAGPPDLSPPQMVAQGGPALAGREGAATGRYLHRLGINMDLAPVLDVPTFSGAFIWSEGRAFSFDASKVAAYGGAFATAMQSAGVAATGKHFPGDGSAAVDTDAQLDELHPSAAQLAAALAPYRAAIPRGLDAVMVTTAGFPAYDASGTPAALSPQIISGLLRGRLGFNGVAITDSLGAPTGHSEVAAGVLAARAGADILLYTDSGSGVLGALESSLARGALTRAAAAASYRRIVALKQKLAAF
ncbi:MAG: glycoside hydrolase family 3 N-terminal domain-containing protein [Solirubrobacteraceae bacterium]